MNDRLKVIAVGGLIVIAAALVTGAVVDQKLASINAGSQTALLNSRWQAAPAPLPYVDAVIAYCASVASAAAYDAYLTCHFGPGGLESDNKVYCLGVESRVYYEKFNECMASRGASR